MKIYITGIAGFLGSHLAKKLKNLGHEVAGNDNLVLGEIENLPKNIRFDKADCNNYNEMVKNLEGFDVNFPIDLIFAKFLIKEKLIKLQKISKKTYFKA